MKRREGERRKRVTNFSFHEIPQKQLLSFNFHSLKYSSSLWQGLLCKKAFLCRLWPASHCLTTVATVPGPSQRRADRRVVITPAAGMGATLETRIMILTHLSPWSVRGRWWCLCWCHWCHPMSLVALSKVWLVLSAHCPHCHWLLITSDATAHAQPPPSGLYTDPAQPITARGCGALTN